MGYKFLTNSEKIWQAMHAEIGDARESVYLEMYIFQDDMTKFDFITLLVEKAKSWVRVRIVLDSFGSAGLSGKSVKSLKDAGVEILFVSHFFHRVHRKILIVDEKTAFVGGVNFHQSARLWDDLMVRAKGKIVSSIIKSFARVYRDAGGQDKRVLDFLSKNKKVIFTKLNTWLVEHSPVRNKFALKKIYTEHLNKAEKQITLVTPYFMPKRWLVTLLDKAIIRGVKVEILVPKTTDIFLIDRVNYFYMKRVAKIGVDIYLEQSMNHAKAMLIDERVGIVGSQNVDILSFDFNSEVGIFFEETDSVTKLSKIVETWKGEATLFNPVVFQRMWFDYILSPVMNLFSRIL